MDPQPHAMAGSRSAHADLRAEPSPSYADAAANPGLSARSATTCSSPTTTSSATKSHTAPSDRTGSASATRQNTTPGASNASSKRSATRSRSRRPNRQTQNKLPDTPTSRLSDLPPTPRRHNRPCPSAITNTGIHRSATQHYDRGVAAHEVAAAATRPRPPERPEHACRHGLDRTRQTMPTPGWPTKARVSAWSRALLPYSNDHGCLVAARFASGLSPPRQYHPDCPSRDGGWQRRHDRLQE